MKRKHFVGIVMGSQTDLKVMKDAARALKEFGISFEMKIVSAHRTPKEVMSYAESARGRGMSVIIAGAGGAAHLPGMIAASTELPVIGVPVPVGALKGQDALLSIVQMPKGVPVATVAIGNAWNAGILAVQIVAAQDGTQKIFSKLSRYKKRMRKTVLRTSLK